MDRLGEDHENTRYLAGRIGELEGFFTDMDKVQINMVFCKIKREDLHIKEFEKELLGEGIKISIRRDRTVRLVTHNYIDREDIDYTIEKMKKVL